MPTPALTVFRLPDRLAAKADPALISADERHFAAIADTIAHARERASSRLDAMLASPRGVGSSAVERDLEVHRLNSRLALLQRFGIELCLGRMMIAGEDEPIYIGRTGLTGEDGRQLLVDWRATASAPFFAATHGDPMGLLSRRRYRWTNGRISDYWDEAFAADGLASAALDDQSAFIASLGASRSRRMQDVLTTIQADQDAIIRAGSDGALVVDGGPGTGKTVVALHRAAYLMYADRRISRGGGGVLVVGPHRPYLAYVDDVLPRLGEESVRLCTLSDLVPAGAGLPAEPDPGVARLKADGRLVDAVEAAVRLYEQPPRGAFVVETPWAEVRLTPQLWEDAFDAAEADQSHADARETVWEAIVEIVRARIGAGAPPTAVRRILAADAGLTGTFDRAWPLLDPSGLLAALWSTPSFLRRCAPWLDEAEVRMLQRSDPRAWTSSDLPLLDAARRLVGDPGAGLTRRRREAARAQERAYRAEVAESLREQSDDDLGLMSMLGGEDVRNSLDDEDALPRLAEDPFGGPFAHIIVDEAQELTDAQWRMLLARCPSRSFTVVGDRAQARHGFAGTWEERLAAAGLRDVAVASLTINYRTPEEIMAEAEPVIRAVLPDANVPMSIRSSGIPVRRVRRSERDDVLARWRAVNDEGTACVIGDAAFAGDDRVLSLTPETAKGLEFDLVVLMDPVGWGEGVEGGVDRYVAMTRSTRELVVLE